MKMNLRPVAILFVAAVATHANAATSFDTTTSWDGSGSISAFGNPNTATYGQTFVAPSSLLDDFTFYVDGEVGVSLSMKAFVWSWSGPLQGNGGQATGTPLYLSSTSIPFSGTGVFQAVTINTGGVTLTPGSDYVIGLTISDPADYAASSGTASWGALLFQHPANDGGGGFVFYNNGGTFGALNTSVWDTFSDFGDVAFKADFSGSGVPEPAAISLIVLGLGSLSLFRAFRRR
jgi:hypothetical protein